MSFDIEPIQLPIVPLNWLSLQSLQTTAACKHAALCGLPWLCSVAAQSSSQTLEVRELAELRRQRAAQAVAPQCPATARRIGSNRGSPRGPYDVQYWYYQRRHVGSTRRAWRYPSS
jgi:hypothetical protein